MMLFNQKPRPELAPAVKDEIKEKVKKYRNELVAEAGQKGTMIVLMLDYFVDNYREGLESEAAYRVEKRIERLNNMMELKR